ncbi:MAG: amylosucrase, partial [Chloroflexota bacterium]|nr:amylosucrase [Chloroflexota bacterium]
TFDDAVAGRLGMNGYDHRRFLNEFYTGRFPGSFARGVPFQENPRTGDARISGTGASLAGLEAALLADDERAIELAIRRILLIHSIILTMGGIPLIYLGDEIGALNDYSYRNDPAKAGDSRWIHRPATDWGAMTRRSDPATVEGRIYDELHRLILIRRTHAVFAGHATTILDAGSAQVFAYTRQGAGPPVLALANFSEVPQTVAANELRLYGLSYRFRDLVSGESLRLVADLPLDSYRFRWLVADL